MGIDIIQVISTRNAITQFCLIYISMYFKEIKEKGPYKQTCLHFWKKSTGNVHSYCRICKVQWTFVCKYECTVYKYNTKRIFWWKTIYYLFQQIEYKRWIYFDLILVKLLKCSICTVRTINVFSIVLMDYKFLVLSTCKCGQWPNILS